MSNFLFHNKFHQANHHTIATPGLPDSATDPIASQSEPFQGIFYNYLNALVNLSAIDVSYLETFLTDSITTFDGLSVNTIQSIYAAITANVFTNSQQWFEMYTNINGLSTIYGLYPTVSTTVNTYSGYWNLGYNFYSSLNALSTNYFSTYTMVNTYSANWPFIDTTLRLNLMQQNTRSKNFSGVNITSISVNTSGVSAYWNLSAAQCAFFRLTGTTVFKNIVNSNNKKKGGEYVLVLQQDGFGNRPVSFESDYVFPTTYLGVASSGALYATGYNNNGQLGLSDFSDRNVFTVLTGNWGQVKCGGVHTMALSTGTTKWFATGDNNRGQLGLDDFSDRTVLTTLTGDWDQMVCGDLFTMAQSAGTTKWFATGYNNEGQLGLGDNSNRNRFTALTGDWNQMGCGGYILAGGRTMALSAGTTKWFATGANNSGQLGLGDNSNRNRFTALTGDWNQMICGSLHTMAQSAGTTKWFATGDNNNGQLGLGDNSDRNRFTALTGTWSQMNGGNLHTMILNTSILPIYGTTNVVAPTALSVTVIRFTCDGSKLYGKPTPYYYERDTIWTYFAGPGLIFTPSPAEFYINDYFIPINGLTVAGVVVPAQGYSDGGGITVVEGLPS